MAIIEMKQRFLGYLNTAFICGGKNVYGLNSYHLQNQKNYSLNQISFTNQRLGKLVEQFVHFQLQQDNNVKLLASNIQIKENKQTIGEIDALLLDENKPIHLEIIYKFYLYDILCNYEEPLAYWIGPNRKDTLLYKLEKLKSKQFPLLYNKLTQPFIDKHNLEQSKIAQHICFKAQLFLPYGVQDIDVKPLNRDCITGFYLSFKDFSILKGFQFYIPKKLDWLIVPHNDVDWVGFEIAQHIIEKQINESRSPLVWLKSNTIEFKKCFITFW